TDFGVCYKFNGDAHNRLNVVRSGARSGLSVMLNIEQYEYMIGPDHESGVKLLLHDPREIPQVRDLGFAVSPGSHVLVGVKKQLIENLEAPYGTCLVSRVFRSIICFCMSACLSRCISNDVFSRCGCRDLHMLPPTKYKDRHFNAKIPLFTNTQPDFSHWITLVYDIHDGLSAFFDLSDNLSSSRLILKLQICSKAEMEAERHQNEKSIHAETENFIKLDIFYKELSYEHIQQQVSFQSLSLFSEIGGFLGLLLGASVLTMLEFIDFFIMLISGYAGKFRQKSN
ncbi:hypothetical protein HELRODRAFT_83577, partial [Helobdella robusta]|uniref:Uncharacterized protein n=1 Tax=Helobdella robusta TaxID=6412 RepID=T1G575_HELRO